MFSDHLFGVRLSALEIKKRPSWRSGSSSAVTLPTDRTLWISLCSTGQTMLIAFLRHAEDRNNSIIFFGNTGGLKIRLLFGNELRHYFVLYGHGQNANSFIQDNSVPFLSPWNCHFQMRKSCAVTKKLSLQELLVSRWVLTRSWYIKRLISRKLQQIVGKFQDGNLLHFRYKQRPQICCYPINCAEDTQYLQLAPFALAWKGRR